MFTIISCVQNTVNHDRHLQCAETIQFSPSCCVQNTDNSHCHVNVCAEHRQFCHVVCAEHKQTTDNSHRHAVYQNTDNCHRHAVCAEHRQTEHRQFSPSCCVCRTQTNRTQTILTVTLCVQNTDNSHRHVVCRTQTNRAQTILTVKLCAEHKENTDNSHCHFVRAEHSWAVTWTRPSAVPTTPCGNCSSRTERGTSTVCDTAACWSVGTDPSRLVWHQDGQTLTQ